MSVAINSLGLLSKNIGTTRQKDTILLYFVTTGASYGYPQHILRDPVQDRPRHKTDTTNLKRINNREEPAATLHVLEKTKTATGPV